MSEKQGVSSQNSVEYQTQNSVKYQLVGLIHRLHKSTQKKKSQQEAKNNVQQDSRSDVLMYFLIAIT